MVSSPHRAAAQEEAPSWDLAQALDFEVGLGGATYLGAGRSTLVQYAFPDGGLGGAFLLDLGASYRLGMHGVGVRASMSFYDANEGAFGGGSSMSIGEFSFMLAPTYRIRPFSTWIARPFHLETFIDAGIGYWEHQQSFASSTGFPVGGLRISGLALPIRVGADVAVWDRLRVGASIQLALVVPTGNSAGSNDGDPAWWLGFAIDVRYTLPFEELGHSGGSGGATEVRLESRHVEVARRDAAPATVTATPEYASAVPTVRTVALLPPESCEADCTAGVEALERALSSAGYRVVPWRTIVEGRRASGSATGTAARLGVDALFQVHRLSVEGTTSNGQWSRDLVGADGLGAEDRAQLEELARAAEAAASPGRRVTLDVEAILIAARARAWRYRVERTSVAAERVEATFRRAPDDARDADRYVMPPTHCQPEACDAPSELACDPSLCGQWFRWSTVEGPSEPAGANDADLLDPMARGMAATFRSGGDHPVDDLAAHDEPQADGPDFGLAPEPPVSPPPLPEGAEQ